MPTRKHFSFTLLGTYFAIPSTTTHLLSVLLLDNTPFEYQVGP